MNPPLLMRTVSRPFRILVVLALAGLAASSARAQVGIRPYVGMQTIIFNGDNQAQRPISGGTDPSLAFGGGLTSANNGVRLGLEVVPDSEGILRIPITAEYYWFDGKTTFAVPSTNRRVQQLRLHYTASMISGGLGVTASFFNKAVASLYFSAEGRFNYFPPTSLSSRRFYLDTDELIGTERTIKPDTAARSRYGAIVRIGTQADFFDPVLLDFSIGYGALNLGGKDTGAKTQRDLLTAEPMLNTAERTLGFITFGLSVVWRF